GGGAGWGRGGGGASLGGRVGDGGAGAPAEALAGFSARHYRVDEAAAREREGEGLGLAIVKDILRLHGCTVKADSQPGEGAVLTFTLPLAASADAAEPGGGETRQQEPPAPSFRREPSRGI